MSTATKTQPVPTSLQVHSLGRTEVLIADRPANWHAQAAKELFFFLLSHPEGSSKDEIFEQLWGLNSDPTSNNRFRVTVHRVRTALGRNDAIIEEYGRYRLSNEVLSSSDIHELYSVLEQAHHASDPNERRQGYQRALNLYVGEYLAGENADWVLEAREEHKAAHVRAALEHWCGRYGPIRSLVRITIKN
jgi:two-component SAPR family response regulator